MTEIEIVKLASHLQEIAPKGTRQVESYYVDIVREVLRWQASAFAEAPVSSWSMKGGITIDFRPTSDQLRSHSGAEALVLMAEPGAPSEEGLRRYPDGDPVGFYDDEPCTCEPACLPNCRGHLNEEAGVGNRDCRCQACSAAHVDGGYWSDGEA